MKTRNWIIGAILLVAALAFIAVGPVDFLLDRDQPHAALIGRALYVLILAAVLCLLRVAVGPTAADRIVAIDILGVLIVGVCALVSIPTGRSWYIDIGIAWALQSFIGTLALSKYLEGKPFDE